MQKSPDLQPVFERLRAIMQKHAAGLEVLKDDAGDYSLNGGYSKELKKEIWFGGVKRCKNYVSYHLIAVYGYPQLLNGASPKLKARMQGKSCFNFREVDPELFEELSALTERSLVGFKKLGWLPE